MSCCPTSSTFHHLSPYLLPSINSNLKTNFHSLCQPLPTPHNKTLINSSISTWRKTTSWWWTRQTLHLHLYLKTLPSSSRPLCRCHRRLKSQWTHKGCLTLTGLIFSQDKATCSLQGLIIIRTPLIMVALITSQWWKVVVLYLQGL